MTNDRIKEIDKKIEELRHQRRELEEKEKEEFLKRAKNNVGRCFIIKDQYVKVIDVPQDDWSSITHKSFNKYQYQALYLTRAYNGRDDAPAYIDTVFSGYWGDGNNVLGDKVEEISEQEFDAEFKKIMCEFIEKYQNINNM